RRRPHVTASPGRPTPMASCPSCFSTLRPPPRSTLFPYTTLFRSQRRRWHRLYVRLRYRGPDSNRRDRQAPLHGRESRTRHGVERSEEHTSELQSRGHLGCRLLPEKKQREQRSRLGRSL